MGDLGKISVKFNKKGATLLVTGPDVKVGPAKVNPTVGVRYDQMGRYHFVIGNKDSTFTPAQVPRQLRQALRSLEGGRRKTNSTTPRIRMPSINDIINNDGNFISFSEYTNQRVSRTVIPDQLVWWPVLSQREYDGYVELCRLFLKQLLPKSMKGNSRAPAARK